ncbi:MAG: DUF72 domain-containing protein [Spirosomataceae bacterium]
MDFGKLPNVDNIDFSLPKDKFLFEKKNIAQPVRWYIGLPIWNQPAWTGKIYTYDAKEGDFLRQYAGQFSTIELNVTHYQIPSEKTVSRWKESVPSNFLFCPKFPQQISHELQLVGAEEQTRLFVERIRGLGTNLGTCFLQLPPTFGPNRLPILKGYLEKLPSDLSISVEFRHPDWFKEEVWEKTCKILQERCVGLVLSDVAGRRDVLHMSITNDTCMIRFVGNELHPTDYERTLHWIEEKLTNWALCAVNKVFIFVHCGDNEQAPELADFWISHLNEKLQAGISQIQWKPKVTQSKLF